MLDPIRRIEEAIEQARIKLFELVPHHCLGALATQSRTGRETPPRRAARSRVPYDPRPSPSCETGRSLRRAPTRSHPPRLIGNSAAGSKFTGEAYISNRGPTLSSRKRTRPRTELKSRDFEVDAEPVAPLSLVDLELLRRSGWANQHAGRRRDRADRQAEVERRTAYPRAFRGLIRCVAMTPSQVSTWTRSPLLPWRFIRRRRVVRRRPETAAEVGYTHPREHPTADRVGRKCARTAQYGRADACIRQRFPNVFPRRQFRTGWRQERRFLATVQCDVRQICERSRRRRKSKMP